MGRLVYKNQLDVDAPWYFTDAYYSSDRRGYVYNWPSEDFPHIVHMHNDTLYHRNERTIQIRKWIEHTLTDTVIVDSIEMDYKKYYGKSYEWEKSYDVRNSWYRFSFENESSATMFALAFSEWIKKPTKWHPDHPEDEEYLNRPLEERYVK